MKLILSIVACLLLLAALGLAFTIGLFYLEEDWRGASAWAATKAEWEAEGESLDYAHFIPPTVPDEQNLAAIPLFKISPAGIQYGLPAFDMPELKTAMRSDEPDQVLPAAGAWQKGVLPDLQKYQTAIAADYSAAFKNAKPPAGTLAQFDALYPFLANLRAESETRPLCRFNFDYHPEAPILRSYRVLTQQIRLSQILTGHAILALSEHQSDLALKDIQLNYRLVAAVKRDPTYIGGLVGMGIAAIDGAAIFDGLASHAWNDIQLDKLEHLLEPMNFLADYQFANRCEAAMDVADTAYFKRAPRARTVELFRLWKSPMFDSMRWTPPWPVGWWDLNLSQFVTAHRAEMRVVDPEDHRVFPSVYRDLEDETLRQSHRWDTKAPWNIWYTLASENTNNLALKYAQAQVWLDETRIACALERYRLAHGVYPPTLAALVPACIGEMPGDIMSGEPYRYRLNPKGTFLLYSVGWNETDDGGTVAHLQNSPKSIDNENGDWVWPGAIN